MLIVTITVVFSRPVFMTLIAGFHGHTYGYRIKVRSSLFRPRMHYSIYTSPLEAITVVFSRPVFMTLIAEYNGHSYGHRIEVWSSLFRPR